jgi:hypothetical protein
MNTYFSNNKRHPETHDTTPRHFWGVGGGEREKNRKSFCGVIYYANGFNAKGNWRISLLPSIWSAARGKNYQVVGCAIK